jgi:stage II sporulation protein D
MLRIAHGCAFLLLAALPARADTLVRVKVFPHNSAFPTPQGAETTRDKVAISATQGTCTIYQAATSSAADPITHDRPLGSAPRFAFDAASSGGPYWVECAPLATVEREAGRESLRYRGTLFVKRIVPAEGAPYLTVINVLPFEDYLRAVVPAEMLPSWPLEALKAQAVAARTYALYELAGDPDNVDPKLTEEASGAELDDTVFFQAYQGESRETAATNQAVAETSGLALYHQGRIIKAYFHGDSGGHTEDAAYGFNIPLPYCVNKAEIYEPGSVPGGAWTVQLSPADLTLKLAKLLPPGAEVERLLVDPRDILPSERPLYVTARLRDGREHKVPSRDFRFALGLRSTWVRFESPKAGMIQIAGRGSGHGVGMSQWGARLMASQLHKNFGEILTFYYTGVQLRAHVAGLP